RPGRVDPAVRRTVQCDHTVDGLRRGRTLRRDGDPGPAGRGHPYVLPPAPVTYRERKGPLLTPGGLSHRLPAGSELVHALDLDQVPGPALPVLLGQAVVGESTVDQRQVGRPAGAAQ